jgi:putative SOS response-associated peptidase YedK
MCGRFAFYSPSEAAAALFGVSTSIEVQPHYNIAPTQFIAAIREDQNEQRELVMLRWGLVPFWAKDTSIGNRMINARAETVAEKPAYRAAYRHRRCVVLADGFYEWRREGDAKTPYYISLASGEPFSLAGLWENWTDKESGDSLQTATLITTEANEFMTPLHHRMPVIASPHAGHPRVEHGRRVACRFDGPAG